ncbi:FRRS1 [Branchiostoma lanceolatum]|nr:FRRS1 [Branchiostoma lanceolatum]
MRLTSADFHDDLLDSGTARHQILGLAVKGEVDRIFEDHPHYRSSHVNHFRQGSVITNVTLAFKKNLTEEEKYEAAAQLFQASESGDLGFTTDRVTVDYGDGTSDTLERCTCSGQPAVTCTTKGATCVPTCVLNKNYCNSGTCSSDITAATLNCKCPSNFVGDRCDNPQIGGLSPAAFACVLLAALAGFALLGCILFHLCCAERCGRRRKHKAYSQDKAAVQPTQKLPVQREQEEQVATVDMSKPAGDDGNYNPSLPRSEAGSNMETIQEEPSDSSLITEPGAFTRPVIPAPLPVPGQQRPLADAGQQEAIENWRRHVVPKAAPPTGSLQPGIAEAPSYSSLPKRTPETARIPEASPMLPLSKLASEANPLKSLQKDISDAPPIDSLQNRIPDTPAPGSLQKRFSEAPPVDYLRNRMPDSASDVTDEVAQLTARWPTKPGGRSTKSLPRRLPGRGPADNRRAPARGIYNPGYYDNFGDVKEMTYKNAEELALG